MRNLHLYELLHFLHFLKTALQSADSTCSHNKNYGSLGSSEKTQNLQTDMEIATRVRE